MPFNADQAKQAPETVFSTKTNKSIHQPLYFKNATVKPTHAQRQLSLQLENKLSSNEYTNNKNIKTTKGKGFLRKAERVLPRRDLLIIC